jgi:hypothetical protein
MVAAVGRPKLSELSETLALAITGRLMNSEMEGVLFPSALFF